MGLLVGAAFLTRAPLAFAAPAVAPVAGADWRRRGRAAGRHRQPDRARCPWRGWILLAVGVLPALAFFFWYNLDRFGDPLESGYALATLPDWLAGPARPGAVLDIAHRDEHRVPVLEDCPRSRPQFPYFRPDGLGMSVFVTSPALLLAVRAPWRDRRSWLLLIAAVLVLIPTLLYYGGGWLQYGYRYFLDSIPFVWALVAMGIAQPRVAASGGAGS